MKLSHLLITILSLVAILALSIYLLTRNSESQITSFEECVAAGNPVMESFPEQCSANGATFTKQY